MIGGKKNKQHKASEPVFNLSSYIILVIFLKLLINVSYLSCFVHICFLRYQCISLIIYLPTPITLLGSVFQKTVDEEV